MDEIQQESKEVQYPDGRIEHLAVRSEPRDIWTKPIMAVFAAGLIVGGLIIAAVWGLFRYSEHEQEQLKASNYPLAPEPSLVLPREPRLDALNRNLGDPRADVYLREKANIEKINQLGPADEKGFVRIPIAEAMKLAVSRLLVRKKAPPGTETKDAGLRFGGGPNSGRIFEEPPK